jgi:uncharacterized OsmC-like protein
MADDTRDSASVTDYRLTATRMSPKRTKVDTGDAEFVVGKDVNPVEFFLGSIMACLNSTGTMVARDMDIDLRELSVTIEGGVDYARYRGEASDSRPGLQTIEASIDVTADVSDSTLATWLDRVKDRCPVTDNVEHETPLAIEFSHG